MACISYKYNKGYVHTQNNKVIIRGAFTAKYADGEIRGRRNTQSWRGAGHGHTLRQNTQSWRGAGFDKRII